MADGDRPGLCLGALGTMVGLTGTVWAWAVESLVRDGEFCALLWGVPCCVVCVCVGGVQAC